jgi:hypothetical protein
MEGNWRIHGVALKDAVRGRFCAVAPRAAKGLKGDAAHRSHNQEQSCADDDNSDGSRNALTSRGETLHRDCCRHHSHHAQIHNSDDEENRRHAGTAVAAV